MTRCHGWQGAAHAHGWTDRYLLLQYLHFHHPWRSYDAVPATHMYVGRYDSKEGSGRVESGTETEMAVRLRLKVSLSRRFYDIQTNICQR